LSLSTYTALKTALADTLHRSDLTSAIPDFITLAEDKLNKRLRIRGMETRATSTATSEYVALPTDFLAMRNFQANTSPRTRLEYATPEYLDKNYGDSATTGDPLFYTFVGGQIQLAPIPASVTLEMDYYKKLDIATDSTNWVLTNAPRCYYYGSLMEASIYLVNDKRVPVWAQLLEQALKEVEDADGKDRMPSSGLQIRSDGPIT
jgi:hypothetical protein